MKMQFDDWPSMNYNTALFLWENYLESRPDDILTMKEGTIWSQKDGAIGRFSTSYDAVRALKGAGYPDHLISSDIKS